MIDDAQLSQTHIACAFKIQPVKHIVGDLSSIIGRSCSELISAFYPRRVAKKANSALTELIDNVLQNIVDQRSPIDIALSIQSHILTIAVKNVATQAQYEKVEAHVERISSAENVKRLFKKVLLERREQRLRGGLGLIRLVAENGFQVQVAYDDPVLSVESRIDLGSLL